MKSKSEVAALIPAYNEEKNIQEVIQKCKSFTDTIFVIDDGSSDSTTPLARKAGAVVIAHDKNKGKGESMKTGMHEIQKLTQIKYIIVIDADMQYNPEEAPELLAPLENGADFVMGYRNWQQVPFRHKLGNFIWKGFFNILFKTKLKDVSCGFIAIDRKAITAIEKMYGGYIIESSILAQAITNNLKIEQVPVNVTYKKLSGFIRGSRIFLGVLVFMLRKGIRYRLK